MEGPPESVRRALVACRRVLLTGPVDPDGDSLGACLALRSLLVRRGVDAAVAGQVPARYRFLPGSDGVIADAEVGTGWDAVVVLDGDRHRLTGPVGAAFTQARLRGIIDHHASTTADGYDLVWIDHESPSTCEMIHRWAVADGCPIDPSMATWLYAGIVFDTGGFRYSNTRPATLRLAADLLETGIAHHDIALRVLAERSARGLAVAGRVFSAVRFSVDGRIAIGRVPIAWRAELGLESGDLEGIVDALVHTEGVGVGALLIEAEGGRVKLSLRSRGSINVAQVAQRITPFGGGHPKAAGGRVDGTLDEVEAALVAAISDLSAPRPVEGAPGTPSPA